MIGTLTLTHLGWFVTSTEAPFGYPLYYLDLQALSYRSDIKLDDRHGQVVEFVLIDLTSPITQETVSYASIIKLHDDTLKPLTQKLKDHLKSITSEQFQEEINEIEKEGYTSGPTMEEFICKMEDCPHCAYERQQEYEAELEKEACIDFGDWLSFQKIDYVGSTDEGNIYMVESNMNKKMTMKQIYELYLKSQ